MLAQNQQILLRRFIERNRHWLAENAAACSHVAYTLAEMEEIETALTWARDWRHLPELQPWMLVIFTEIFWVTGRYDEVTEISWYALQLPPDHSTPTHRIWLAAVAAFSGRPENAPEHLAKVNPMQLDPNVHFLSWMTDAVVRLSTAEPKTHWPLFQEIRRQINNSVENIKKLPKVKPLHRRFYNQSLRQMIRVSGDFRIKLWCFWMLLHHL